MARCHYFFLLGMLLGGWIPQRTLAQSLYVGENQSLYIAENTMVVLGVDLHNRGTIVNQGSLQIPEDLTNAQTFRSGPNSEVLLSGQESQRIDMRGQSFHHLTIQGGGTKELLSEARVTGRLTLSDGLVVPHPTASLTLEASATIVGGDENSYVEASMQYQGNGVRMFPLGLDGTYLPITLTEVSGQSPTLRVSVVAPHPPAVPGEKLARVSTARYWQVTAIEGTYDGSVAQLTVTADDAFEDLIGAVVVQADKPGGTFTNLGQSAYDGNASQGSVTGALPVTQPIVALGLTSEFSLADQVLIPSAFAPNAPDPINRFLKVYATTLLPEPFTFRIFDRWGTLVYRTQSLAQARDQGWNGLRQSDQSPAPPGVYQYYLQGVFENNSPVDQTGTISLFR